MLRSNAAIAIWNDVADGAAPAFDDWHVNEHMPERLAIPGFLRGRRYMAPGGGHYFTLYETRDKDVQTSSTYLARLNDPTPWSKRIVPLVTSRRRTALDIVLSSGDGVGGALATVEFAPVDGADELLSGWLSRIALPQALSRPGIVGAHWGRADAVRSRLDTVEERLMVRPDDVARWVVLLEGIDVGEAGAAAAAVVARLEAEGALPDHAAEVFLLTNLLEARP